MSDPRKWRAFASYYVGECNFNASKAAEKVGVKKESAGTQGYLWLKNPKVREMIDEKLASVHMSADEALKLLADIARGDVGKFIDKDGALKLTPTQTKLIKKIKKKTTTYSNSNFDREIESEEIELYSALDAIDKVLRVHGKYNDKLNLNMGGAASDAQPFVLPADVIGSDYFNVYRDIRNSQHNEYTFDGGRGSLKSSFISLIINMLLVNNPDVHALVLRQVQNTLEKSVYNQLKWAIEALGLSDKFKFKASPLEIQYLPTGQNIYLRGADDPTNIKSIKPPFGYIGILWFEEFDQFRGEDQVRNIVQSAFRGGDRAWRFESWNTPRSVNHWVNKYIAIPKAERYHHHSTYLNVPKEWIGKIFLDEAEHLKIVNPTAYEHEYLGIANGLGGMVFENVIVRKITDEEIAQFDRVGQGVDWGYFPDPFVWGRSHYDAARLKLYVFDEYWAMKKSNRATYDHLFSKERTKKHPTLKEELLIADSAEPKSVGDYRAYGANIRGAEKGPDSVNYSMKWLQSLVEIVIDPERAPHHAEEFTSYELEQDKDGNYISEYPDKNNHCIDEVRYRTNLIWRRRGE